MLNYQRVKGFSHPSCCPFNMPSCCVFHGRFYLVWLARLGRETLWGIEDLENMTSEKMDATWCLFEPRIQDKCTCLFIISYIYIIIYICMYVCTKDRLFRELFCKAGSGFADYFS